MFIDKRSKKVVFVAHCLLNQNTKLDQCAHYPGAIREVTELIIDEGIGLIQMPCPEMAYLGLDREADQSTHPSIEAEDTRIARRMTEPQAQKLCLRIIEDIIDQIEAYKAHEFEVIGLIGINGSPTCGVETTWRDGVEMNGPGVLIKVLNDELQKKDIHLRMTGIKAYQPDLAIRATRALLKDN